MLDDYTLPTPNGGVIGKLSRRCAQQINVRGAGSYIELRQGTRHLLVSEAQLQLVLDAVMRAKGYLGWKDAIVSEPSCGRPFWMNGGQYHCDAHRQGIPFFSMPPWAVCAECTDDAPKSYASWIATSTAVPVSVEHKGD
jgi:hypothetical protein